MLGDLRRMHAAKAVYIGEVDVRVRAIPTEFLKLAANLGGCWTKPWLRRHLRGVEMMKALSIRELRSEDLIVAADLTARGMRDNPLDIAVLGPDSEKRCRLPGDRQTGEREVLPSIRLSDDCRRFLKCLERMRNNFGSWRSFMTIMKSLPRYDRAGGRPEFYNRLGGRGETALPWLFDLFTRLNSAVSYI